MTTPTAPCAILVKTEPNDLVGVDISDISNGLELSEMDIERNFATLNSFKPCAAFSITNQVNDIKFESELNIESVKLEPPSQNDSFRNQFVGDDWFNVPYHKNAGLTADSELPNEVNCNTNDYILRPELIGNECNTLLQQPYFQNRSDYSGDLFNNSSNNMEVKQEVIFDEVDMTSHTQIKTEVGTGRENDGKGDHRFNLSHYTPQRNNYLFPESEKLFKEKFQLRDCYVVIERLNNDCVSFSSRQLTFSSHQQVADNQLSCRKCNICQKVLKNVKYLKVHMLGSHGSRVACAYCKKDYSSKANLLNHIKAKHTSLRFKCALCDKVLSSKHSLQSHMGRHTKPFNCPHCDRSFSTQVILDNHTSSHFGKKYSCNLCPSSFGSHAYLRCHMNAVHRPRLNVASSAVAARQQCHLCSASYARKDRLQNHIKDDHGDPSDFIFKCEFCSMTFATTTKRQNHTHKVHVLSQRNRNKYNSRNNPAYKCNICQNSFRTQQEVIYHQERHAVEKPHKCPLCNEMFSSISNLVHHKKSHRSFKCHECEQSYCKKDNLLNHMKEIHLKEEIHTCPRCPKTFASRRQFLNHRCPGHNKEYKCKICNFEFLDNQALVLHLETHKEEHVCVRCNENFKSANSLRKHVKEKHACDYQCDFCQQSFMSARDLIFHQEEHTQVKNEECEVCHERFSFVGNLKLHKEIHVVEKNMRGRHRKR